MDNKERFIAPLNSDEIADITLRSIPGVKHTISVNYLGDLVNGFYPNIGGNSTKILHGGYPSIIEYKQLFDRGVQQPGHIICQPERESEAEVTARRPNIDELRGLLHAKQPIKTGHAFVRKYGYYYP